MAPVGDSEPTWSHVAAQDRSCSTYTPTPSLTLDATPFSKRPASITIYSFLIRTPSHSTTRWGGGNIKHHRHYFCLDGPPLLCRLLRQRSGTVHRVSIVAARLVECDVLHDGHFSDCQSLLPCARPAGARRRLVKSSRHWTFFIGSYAHSSSVRRHARRRVALQRRAVAYRPDVC
ncbi:hypothetical protein EXIGLDRAFT_490089 [Exidia glandulosa HHB12029]|uniref:Uncharacterized protein n=1 Tax=Exidia glandulosa HHB12029 TaxID=1314781 RepID=A0A165JML9_EXIGL|nr:hypothetical protein EXIGLDRAFT_490089 [Exidia glandulosa HHB12029]